MKIEILPLEEPVVGKAANRTSIYFIGRIETIAKIGDDIFKLKAYVSEDHECPAPYRISPMMRKEIKRQIDDMLEQRIIEPSTSPFASPIMLVPKRDNSWRFAVDYKKLNSLTKKQAYVLTLLTNAIDSVSGKRYFTTCDLQAGFWQVDVEPSHRERKQHL
jgi:hypothetical protein